MTKPVTAGKVIQEVIYNLNQNIAKNAQAIIATEQQIKTIEQIKLTLLETNQSFLLTLRCLEDLEKRLAFYENT